MICGSRIIRNNRRIASSYFLKAFVCIMDDVELELSVFMSAPLVNFDDEPEAANNVHRVP